MNDYQVKAHLMSFNKHLSKLLKRSIKIIQIGIQMINFIN